MAQTEAQKKATKRYREKNKERTKIRGYARTGKAFILNYATLEDLELFESYIEARRVELNKKP